MLLKISGERLEEFALQFVACAEGAVRRCGCLAENDSCGILSLTEQAVRRFFHVVRHILAGKRFSCQEQTVYGNDNAL
jgi:hypothetical protein